MWKSDDNIRWAKPWSEQARFNVPSDAVVQILWSVGVRAIVEVALCQMEDV